MKIADCFILVDHLVSHCHPEHPASRGDVTDDRDRRRAQQEPPASYPVAAKWRISNWPTDEPSTAHRQHVWPFCSDHSAGKINQAKENRRSDQFTADDERPAGIVLPDTAAMARKFSGTSSVAIVSMPRLVVGNFQRCAVYSPTPNIAAVTVVKIKNLRPECARSAPTD